MNNGPIEAGPALANRERLPAVDELNEQLQQINSVAQECTELLYQLDSMLVGDQPQETKPIGQTDRPSRGGKIGRAQDLADDLGQRIRTLHGHLHALLNRL